MTSHSQCHEESGESFHVPGIVHRTGGVPADKLNTCGICGVQIIPGTAAGNWIAVSDEDAESIRKGFQMISHSQAGEDLIVAKCFPEGFTGTLLEIGAWDPIALSNSRMLIEAGWRAVLCEFSPGPVQQLVAVYDQHLKVQVICAAVTVGDDAVQEFQITDDAVSSRDDGVLKTWKAKGGYYGSLWVPTLPLDRLLLQFFGVRKLDYASIDTEGTSVDLAIALLKTEHRPNVLCCEHDGRQVELMQMAQELGYKAIHMNSTNIILSGRW